MTLAAAKTWRKHELKAVADETLDYCAEVLEHYGNRLQLSISGTTVYTDLNKLPTPIVTKTRTENKDGKRPTAVAADAKQQEATATNDDNSSKSSSKPAPATKAGGTLIEVRDMDTIDAALEMIAAGLNPLVLNFASDAKPGGGWLHGASAQEEELFRRSTYVLSLGQKRIRRLYPWRSPTTVIYSPDVIVFRGSRTDSYRVLDWPDCRAVCFIAAAAPRRNLEVGEQEQQEEKLPEDVAKTVLVKMRMIFRIARLHGHDSLVLGAWGSGAFCCPPKHMAALWKQVIEEEQQNETTSQKPLKQIVFAVLRNRRVAVDVNLETYQQMFPKQKDS